MHGNMNIKFRVLISLSMAGRVVKLKVKCCQQVPELCLTLLQIIGGTTVMEIWQWWSFVGFNQRPM